MLHRVHVQNDNRVTSADELRSLATRLVTLADSLDRHNVPRSEFKTLFTGRNDSASLLLLALAEYSGRRRRTVFISDHMFAEPAWDILLDLYIRQAQGKRTSVSDACTASAVSATTGLRWLAALRVDGLVERKASEHDGRVEYVFLSDAGVKAMSDWLRFRATLSG